MKAKINDKIICIPPFLSTSWDQISFLHSEEDPETKRLSLIIHLIDGKTLHIKDMEPAIVEIAFSAHMQYLEKSEKIKAGGGGLQNLIGDNTLAFPIKMGISSFPLNLGNIDNLEQAFQHNQAQSQSPPLPPEIIEKIAQVTKLLTNGDLSSFPKPEPHCHCLHCQVARSLHKIPTDDDHKEIEEVSEEDLKFKNWDILQTGDKLFTVTNPIDAREKYNVFLGSPVGCTCGHPHCEHIKAVLYS